MSLYTKISASLLPHSRSFFLKQTRPLQKATTDQITENKVSMGIPVPTDTSQNNPVPNKTQVYLKKGGCKIIKAKRPWQYIHCKIMSSIYYRKAKPWKYQIYLPIHDLKMITAVEMTSVIREFSQGFTPKWRTGNNSWLLREDTSVFFGNSSLIG